MIAYNPDVIDLPIGIPMDEFEIMVGWKGLKGLLRKVKVGQTITIGDYHLGRDDVSSLQYFLHVEIERARGGRYRMHYGCFRFSKAKAAELRYYDGWPAHEFKIDDAGDGLHIVNFGDTPRKFVREFIKLCRFCEVVRGNELKAFYATLPTLPKDKVLDFPMPQLPHICNEWGEPV